MLTEYEYYLDDITHNYEYFRQLYILYTLYNNSFNLFKCQNEEKYNYYTNSHLLKKIKLTNLTNINILQPKMN